MPVATIITSSAANQRLMRLLQLSSAALPVGAYSFSQGLEYAIDSGWLKNEDDVENWLAFLMTESLAQVDIPLLLRLTQAYDDGDSDSFYYWNAYVLACRETSELRLTETAMGEALVRLMKSLEIPLPASQDEQGDISFIAAFAATASSWQIDVELSAVGYIWSWLENQVAAATKLVPLGQTSAQKLLSTLGEQAEPLLVMAQAVEDKHIGSSLPGLAMASSWHETQYSRLFRS